MRNCNKTIAKRTRITKENTSWIATRYQNTTLYTRERTRQKDVQFLNKMYQNNVQEEETTEQRQENCSEAVSQVKQENEDREWEDRLNECPEEKKDIQRRREWENRGEKRGWYTQNCSPIHMSMRISVSVAETREQDKIEREAQDFWWTLSLSSFTLEFHSLFSLFYLCFTCFDSVLIPCIKQGKRSTCPMKGAKLMSLAQGF